MSAGNHIAFAAIFVIAILAGLVVDPPEPITKKQILRSLIDAGAPTNGPARVAVGTNANVDLVVQGIELMQSIKDIPVPIADAEPSKYIETKQDLANTFAYFLSRGAAAERFVSPGLFSELVQSANNIASADDQVGGNAALMAQAFNQGGDEVLLGGPIGSKLQGLLEFVGESTTEVDDVHIICEYPEGAEWAGQRAERANRFILSPDISLDAAKETLQKFGDSVGTFKPDLLVLSGLQLFEGTKAPLWRSFLEALKESDALKHAKNAGKPVHLELASLANDEFNADIVKHTLPHVNSIGLNEEELHSLFVTMGGTVDVLPEKCAKEMKQETYWLFRWRAFRILSKFVKKLTKTELKTVIPPFFNGIYGFVLNMTGLTLNIFKVEAPKEDATMIPCLVGKTPNIEAVTAALKFVVAAQAKHEGTVSRVHFHSLSYHIVALTDSEMWPHASAAVAQGSKAVTLQACNVTKESELHGDDLNLLISTKVNTGAGQTQTIARDKVVLEWQSDNIQFSFAPVLVCKKAVRTVGLGDLTSASALSRHL